MPENKQLNAAWIKDAQGAYAQVQPADVATWKARGWAEAPDGPAHAFVWLQNENHGGKAKFPVGAAERWSALGWLPSAPPEPVDLTKDPELVDVTAEPAKKSIANKAATGGDTKE